MIAGHEQQAAARAAGTAPRIRQGRPVKVAVVSVVGPRHEDFTGALRALYASVGAVRAAHHAGGRSFEIGPLRARFPEAQTGPVGTWTWALAVRVPEETVFLPQFDPRFTVRIEVWVYDLVAEVVHEGTEDAKPASVHRLLEHVIAKGYRPAGLREEIYLGTGSSGGRTLLRYPVVPIGRRQGAGARESSLRTARARRSISSL